MELSEEELEQQLRSLASSESAEELAVKMDLLGKTRFGNAASYALVERLVTRGKTDVAWELYRSKRLTVGKLFCKMWWREKRPAFIAAASYVAPSMKRIISDIDEFAIEYEKRMSKQKGIELVS